jgi:hypothetical protein
MEWAIIGAPWVAVGALGAGVAVWSIAQGVAAPRLGRWWIGAFALCLSMAVLASSVGWRAEWLSVESLRVGLGGALLLLAGLVAARAARALGRADALIAAVPRPLEEGLAECRRTGRPVSGAFVGRLGADDQVTSPSGVVCAFYRAQVREAGERRRGALLTSDEAMSARIWLNGQGAQVAVAAAPRWIFAGESVRRCLVAQRLVLPPFRALAHEAIPTDAVAHEQLARLGEPCVAVGALVANGHGGYQLQAEGGGPASLVIGAEVAGWGRALRRRAWLGLAASAGLVIAAARLMTAAGPAIF